MTLPKLITLTSDFGVQTQGIGAMEAAIFEIAPQTRVIHLMHGLPEYNIIAAARTLETLKTFPVGYHVCVCDPGVGTSRLAVAIQTGRGDILIGPDNGVLMPAARLLGGAVKAYEIQNPKYMRPDVSAIFHGRDIFSPAAAHLSNGVQINELGPEVPLTRLTIPAYNEAKVFDNRIEADIIQINRFGSLHLNILHAQWDELHFELGQEIRASFLEAPDQKDVALTVARTFGDVPVGDHVILKDDYGRVEVAKNMGRFVDDVQVAIGSRVIIPLQP